MEDPKKLLKGGDIGESVVEINDGHVGEKEQSLETKQSTNETCNSCSRCKENGILLQHLANFRDNCIVQILKTSYT